VAKGIGFQLGEQSVDFGEAGRVLQSGPAMSQDLSTVVMFVTKSAWGPIDER
jgi:hypothetical protein